MAHLLMIESWVGASGNLLPPLVKAMGHSYTFVTRKLGHYQSAHSTDIHPVVRYADEVLVLETNDTASLIEALRPYSFDGAITVCDYYIETVQAVASALGLPCPFPASVRTVRHKHLMRQALDRAGLGNPAYRLANSLEESVAAAAGIGYPLVMKPVDLASSAFVSLIRNDAELQDAYRALEQFPLNFRDQQRDRTVLLEAYMQGEEVSVESMTYRGETTVIGVTDKSVTGQPYFIENGHMFPAPLGAGEQAEITQFVLDALRATGYDHGIAHTEVKLTAEGPRIVEINPRTAGNYIVELIQRVTKIDMLEAFVALSLGQRPKQEAGERSVASAAVAFFVPSRSGTVAEVIGADTLEADPRIVRYKLERCEGRRIEQPVDNACYLGHVVTEDPEGMNARSYAEQARERIRLRMHEDAGSGESEATV